MALYQTPEAKGSIITPGPLRTGEVCCISVDYTIPAGLALNDIVEMLPLPALCTVVDATLVSDDLDSNGAPLIALDVGLLSGDAGKNDAARTIGNEFFAADTIGRTGGVSRMSKAAGFRVAKVDQPRGIGFKVATAAATLTPGGKVTLLVYVKQ